MLIAPLRMKEANLPHLPDVAEQVLHDHDLFEEFEEVIRLELVTRRPTVAKGARVPPEAWFGICVLAIFVLVIAVLLYG